VLRVWQLGYGLPASHPAPAVVQLATQTPLGCETGSQAWPAAQSEVDAQPQTFDDKQTGASPPHSLLAPHAQDPLAVQAIPEGQLAEVAHEPQTPWLHPGLS
jgi:hypothetical protein